MEEVFHDPYDVEGSNRTGIYTVRMNLHQNIPEWLPLDGLRVKIQHNGMQKLCNTCYGRHLRKDCTEEKVSWPEYIKRFRLENKEIPDDFYGKWAETFKQEVQVAPREQDFNLPTTKVELEEMLSLMYKCGIERSTAVTMLRERKEKFDLAVENYSKQINKDW